jgi:hypothetical protein
MHHTQAHIHTRTHTYTHTQDLSNFQNEFSCHPSTRIVRPRSIQDVQEAVKLHTHVQANGEGEGCVAFKIEICTKAHLEFQVTKGRDLAKLESCAKHEKSSANPCAHVFLAFSHVRQSTFNQCLLENAKTASPYILCRLTHVPNVYLLTILMVQTTRHTIRPFLEPAVLLCQPQRLWCNS